MILADDFGALGEFIWRLYVIVASAAMLLSLVAAAYGARHGVTIRRMLPAMLCGFLSGVAVAAFVAIALLSSNAPVGFVLGLALGPLFGGAMSYFVARALSSGPKRSGENRNATPLT